MCSVRNHTYSYVCLRRHGNIFGRQKKEKQCDSAGTLGSVVGDGNFQLNYNWKFALRFHRAWRCAMSDWLTCAAHISHVHDFKNVMISQAAHHQHYITEEEEEEVKYTRRSVQHSQFNWQNERANGFLCKQIQYFIWFCAYVWQSRHTLAMALYTHTHHLQWWRTSVAAILHHRIDMNNLMKRQTSIGDIHILRRTTVRGISRAATAAEAAASTGNATPEQKIWLEKHNQHDDTTGHWAFDSDLFMICAWVDTKTNRKRIGRQSYVVPISNGVSFVYERRRAIVRIGDVTWGFTHICDAVVHHRRRVARVLRHELFVCSVCVRR